MKLLLLLAGKSIWNRQFTTILMTLSVALSVFMILGIERIRTGAKKAFQNTISGTDLILGARGGNTQLLLFSVFQIGNPANNISWDSYERFSSSPDVLEAVPISLGDSHRGFRVVGTTPKFFSFYQYSGGIFLRFDTGHSFADSHETVIGAEIAKKFAYKVEQQIILAHGTGEITLQEHEDQPFVIVGILAATGTPIDRSIYVPLEGIESIHDDFRGPASAPYHHEAGPQHAEISAAYLRLKSKFGILQLQRDINQYENEPLTAILPGLTLLELWRMIGVVENALLTITFLAFIISLIGMVLVFLSGLNERRREMAIFRSVGAGPAFVFSLLVFEAMLLATLGVITGFLLLNGFLFATQSIIQNKLGLEIALFIPNMFELIFASLVLAGALFAAIIPAVQAYRSTLSDGLTIQN